MLCANKAGMQCIPSQASVYIDSLIPINKQSTEFLDVAETRHRNWYMAIPSVKLLFNAKSRKFAIAAESLTGMHTKISLPGIIDSCVTVSTESELITLLIIY